VELEARGLARARVRAQDRSCDCKGQAGARAQSCQMHLWERKLKVIPSSTARRTAKLSRV